MCALLHTEPQAKGVRGRVGRAAPTCCPHCTPSHPAPGGQVPTAVHTPTQAPCCSLSAPGSPTKHTDSSWCVQEHTQIPHPFPEEQGQAVLSLLPMKWFLDPSKDGSQTRSSDQPQLGPWSCSSCEEWGEGHGGREKGDGGRERGKRGPRGGGARHVQATTCQHSAVFTFRGAPGRRGVMLAATGDFSPSPNS